MKNKEFLDWLIKEISIERVSGWIKEAIELGAKEIAILYFDEKYAPFYLVNGGGEAEILKNNPCGEDVLKGIINIKITEKHLKSLIK